MGAIGQLMLTICYLGGSALRVAFYVPSPALVRSAPATTADYWPWIIEAVRAAPAQLGDGRGVCPWLGPYNWTIQTCLELKSSGFACELTATLPDQGIVIAHGDFLPPKLAASERQFIVEIKPDRPQQCLFANIVVSRTPAIPFDSGRRGCSCSRSLFPTGLSLDSSQGTRREATDSTTSASWVARRTSSRMRRRSPPGSQRVDSTGW